MCVVGDRVWGVVMLLLLEMLVSFSLHIHVLSPHSAETHCMCTNKNRYVMLYCWVVVVGIVFHF